MELHRAAYHGDVAALTALLKKTKDPLLLAERDTHGTLRAARRNAG